MNCPARNVARTTFISGLSNRGRGRNRPGSNSTSFFGRANTGSLIAKPPVTWVPRGSLSSIAVDPSLTGVNPRPAGNDTLA